MLARNWPSRTIRGWTQGAKMSRVYHCLSLQAPVSIIRNVAVTPETSSVSTFLILGRDIDLTRAKLYRKRKTDK